MNLSFSQLITGKTDARNEVKLNNETSIKNFLDVFIEPDGFNIDEFINGEKYIISGLKGTGKTALLRYIALKLPKEASSDFVYFKSDLKEDDRDEIEKLATFEVKTDLGFERNDYEKAWKWFFLKRIIEINDLMKIFREDETFIRVKTLLLSVKCDKSKSGLSYLFPEVTNGNVSINIAEIAKIGFDFKIREREKNEIKFNDIVDKAYDLFINLTTNKALYLLVDELELSYLSESTYRRDSELIRDLLIVVNELNSAFKEMEIDISLVASIRSEVLNAVGVIGKEISKISEDFGFPITWYRYEKGKIDHPLIKMLLNRFRISEKKVFGACEQSDHKLFEKYFQDEMYGRKMPHILLNSTWYRPRDMVRWVNVIKKIKPSETFINQSVYESVRREYSNLCLTEVLEELSTVYDKDHLQAIQTILTDFQKQFEIKEFENRLAQVARSNATAKQILETNKTGVLLTHLYSCGVIGNIYTTQVMDRLADTVRWIYRGDNALLDNRKMMIHPSLRPALSIRDYK